LSGFSASKRVRLISFATPGGIVTEDALGSLLISHYLLGTQELMVINHTDCGMLTFSDEELRARLQQQTGTASITPGQFHAFRDVEENVRQQIEKLRTHPPTT
jgi:carbonic anhydrase